MINIPSVTEALFLLSSSIASQTEESMDNFDFPMARLFCQRALDIEPTNLEVLDMMGNICSELGEVDRAKQISFHFPQLLFRKQQIHQLWFGSL